MSSTIAHIIFDLKTLSKLGVRQKVNTSKEYIFIEDESAFQGVHRWRDGASRDRTVSHIIREVITLVETTTWITESRHFLASLCDDDEKKERIVILENASTALLYAIPGLKNMIIGYDDTNITAKLEPLIQLIEEHIEFLDKFLLALTPIV